MEQSIKVNGWKLISGSQAENKACIFTRVIKHWNQVSGKRYSHCSPETEGLLRYYLSQIQVMHKSKSKKLLCSVQVTEWKLSVRLQTLHFWSYTPEGRTQKELSTHNSLCHAVPDDVPTTAETNESAWIMATLYFWEGWGSYSKFWVFFALNNAAYRICQYPYEPMHITHMMWYK